MTGQTPISRIIFYLLMFGVGLTCSFAQQPDEGNKEKPQPPRAEKFAASDSLVMSWRSFWQTCAAGFVPNPQPDCPPTPRGDVFNASHLLTLYKMDGAVWHGFSVDPKNEAYFMTAFHEVLKPLGPSGYPMPAGYFHYPDLIFLRIVRESSHWYEVEVNEESHETQYVLKSDRLWAKTDWFGVFNMSFNVVVDQTKVKLRYKPNGDVIERCADSTFARMNFAGLDGDWMQIRAGSSDTGKSCNGWIRWRDGREILVGSILNGMRIPNAQASENK